MKIIKTGSTRLVILTDKYAIKIPRCCIKSDNSFYGKTIGFLEGWLANRYEYKWYKSNVFDFLCQVEYSFLFSMVIIMKKAEPISYDEFFELKQYNFAYEHKVDSYGKINDKVYIIDYGN